MAWYNLSCLCGVKLTALWAPAKRPISETYDVTNYGGGWRKDGMNWCSRFEATITVKDVWPPVEPVACCTIYFSNWHLSQWMVLHVFHADCSHIFSLSEFDDLWHGCCTYMSVWVNEEGRLLLVFYTDCSHSFSSGEFDGLWHWCCTSNVSVSEWRRRMTFACVSHWLHPYLFITWIWWSVTPMSYRPVCLQEEKRYERLHWKRVCYYSCPPNSPVSDDVVLFVVDCKVHQIVIKVLFST